MFTKVIEDYIESLEEMIDSMKETIQGEQCLAIISDPNATIDQLEKKIASLKTAIDNGYALTLTVKDEVTGDITDISNLYLSTLIS